MAISGVLVATGLVATSRQAAAQTICSANRYCYAIGRYFDPNRNIWFDAVGADLWVDCLHVGDRQNTFANFNMWMITNMHIPQPGTFIEQGMRAGKLGFSPGKEVGFLWYWADARPGSLGYHEHYMRPALTGFQSNVAFYWRGWNEPNNWDIYNEGQWVGRSIDNGMWAGEAQAGIETITNDVRIYGEANNFRYFNPNLHWMPVWGDNDAPDLLRMNWGTGWVHSATHTACDQLGAQRREKVEEPARLSPSEVRAFLPDLLATVSSGNGEPNPTEVQVVTTTRQAAASLVSRAMLATDQPVYAIQARGYFNGALASVPAGQPAPKGDTLSLTVDAATGHLLDWGISRSPVDLARLGTVMSLS